MTVPATFTSNKPAISKKSYDPKSAKMVPLNSARNKKSPIRFKFEILFTDDLVFPVSLEGRPSSVA